MDCYLKRALEGFIPDNAEINLVDNELEVVDFILCDVDDDGQPEIFLVFKNKNKNYLVLLKRKNFEWKIIGRREITEFDNPENFNHIRAINVKSNMLTNANPIKIEQLFDSDKISFISVIGETMYEGEIILSKQRTSYASPAAKMILDEMEKFPIVPLPDEALGAKKSAIKSITNYKDNYVMTPVQQSSNSSDVSAIPPSNWNNNSYPLPPSNWNNNGYPLPPSDWNNNGYPLPPSDWDNSYPFPPLNWDNNGYPVNPLPENNKPVAPLPGDNTPINPLPPVNSAGDYITGAVIPRNFIIATQKIANVKGGSGIEIVKLAGQLPYSGDTSYYSNLTLFIEDGNGGSNIQIILPLTSGYDPSLELVNFSGEAYKDIVVKIADSTKTSISVFIYSFNTGNLRMIFDSRDFNMQFGGTVTYTNDYKVNISMSTGSRFILDISQNNYQTLSKVYKNNGYLIGTKYGQILPLSKIDFIQYWGKNTKNLATIQPIAGINKDDILAYIVTTFIFNYQINGLEMKEQNIYMKGLNF